MTLPGGVERWIPVVVVSVAVLPLGAIAVWALARRRPFRDSLAEVAMLAGTIPWIWMILTPLAAPGEVTPVPLLDIVHQVAVSPVAAFFQIMGNLLVFAAFGFFAPIRWRIGRAQVVLVAALGSATVEALQFVLDLGRVTSIDDVLLNAAGAGLAAVASRRWWRAESPTSSVR